MSPRTKREVDPAENDRGRSSGPFQALLLALVSFYLYINLFTFSNVPRLVGGDQTWFWTFATRMLHDEHAYRDFFQFTPPGTDLVYFGLFRIFGPEIWVTNLAIILLGVALCWICFNIAVCIMERSWALVATAFFLVFVYGRLLDATHHWFSLLAVLCAIRLLMPERTALSVASAGALLGAASFFTQTAGISAGLALCVAFAWEHFAAKKPWRIVIRHQLLLLMSLVLVLSALSAHLIVEVGWKQLWYLWVVYPQRYVEHRLFQPGLLKHPTPGELSVLVQHLFIFGLMLGVYPTVVWYCWRKRRESTLADAMKLVVLSLTGFFLLLSIIFRADFVRIYCLSMPAIVLFVWLMAGVSKPRQYAKTAMWVVVIGSALRQTASSHRPSLVVMDLPAGPAALADKLYSPDELAWLAQHTSPGEVFFQAGWLNTYLPLELRSPVFVEFLSRGMPPEYLDLTTRQVEQSRVKYILWPAIPPSPDDLDISERDAFSSFRKYLESRYAPVQVFANKEEVWQRK